MNPGRLHDLLHPAVLAAFDRAFFDIPHGRREDWLFEQFKDRLDKEGVPPEEELVGFATKVKKVLEEGSTTIGDE